MAERHRATVPSRPSTPHSDRTSTRVHHPSLNSSTWYSAAQSSFTPRIGASASRPPVPASASASASRRENPHGPQATYGYHVPYQDSQPVQSPYKSAQQGQQQQQHLNQPQGSEQGGAIHLDPNSGSGRHSPLGRFLRERLSDGHWNGEAAQYQARQDLPPGARNTGQIIYPHDVEHTHGAGPPPMGAEAPERSHGADLDFVGAHFD